MAKPLTQTQIIKQVADKSGLENKQVKEVLKALEEVTIAELKRRKQAKVLGIINLKIIQKPAKPARRAMMFGEMRDLPAKQASRSVKAYALKKLKDTV